LTYLEDLRRYDGFLTVEPKEPPLFTVEDSGDVIMEWPTQRLAVRLTAATTDGLAAGIEEARHREAETEIDDAGLWPAHG